ncbi:MAG: PEP-CTERM/exosortase system-associated acyltransferase [Gammaproteobacteria bacterium]|nr:PEP-CTERM/exosortase system-associated acyltransferase [Gammaproteobacteria bacterium]
MGELSASLAESFHEYFSVDLATTAEQKQEIYRVRYRVYCDEFGFEDADRFPDKAEHDEFDDYAIHCLVTHRASGIPAGCVRLVPATVSTNYHILPFEKFCAAGLDSDYLHSMGMDRRSICEISRLAVDSSFRQRSGEDLTRLGKLNAMDFSHHEERTFSLVAVAGYLATTALTGLTGKTNVFALMEPFLPDVLQKAGITFRRVGREVDYHGIRAPYFVQTESVLDSMSPEIRQLYDAIYEQMEGAYQETGGVYADAAGCQQR